jgi:EmrB/QacA subfamily drug resistance transporter
LTTTDNSIAERDVLAAVAFGTMLAPLNSTMIVVALPTILREFEHSLSWGAWIVIAYLVTMAAGQPLGGSLGDRYGQRRVFQTGLVAHLAASALAVLSPSLTVLIVARVSQAVAGALVVPNGMALVRSLIPAERHGVAFGRVGAGVAMAATLGAPLGGALTDTIGWRAMFAANIVLIAPALLLSLRLAQGETAARVGRFDLYGAALLTSALSALSLSLTIWRSAAAPSVLAPLCGLITLGASMLLWRHMSRHPAPVVQLRLFRQAGFTLASLVATLSNLTMYTVLLSLPVFLTERDDWSSSATGVLLASMSLQMIVCAPFGGWLADRRGWRFPTLLGAALLAIGALLLVFIDTGWDWAAYLGPLVALGAGVGLASAPAQALALESAPSDVAGQAAGLFSTTTYLGSILGAAGMAAILGEGVPSVASFRVLYGAVAVAAVLGVVVAARLPAGHGRRIDEQQEQAAARSLAPSGG